MQVFEVREGGEAETRRNEPQGRADGRWGRGRLRGTLPWPVLPGKAP